MAARPIKRVLIANRGEIAVRVIRACRALGLESVVAVSQADLDSLPARMATRSVCIGPAPARDSYLRPELMVMAAKGTGCDAIHPGYGFLSERAAFARLCAEHEVTFIGPSPEAISLMGDKLAAVELASASSVPRVPGSGPITTVAEARQFMELAPLTVIGPATAIVFATLTFIVLANGLREWLDVGSR